MFFNWADEADKSKSHTWCSTVKKRIKAHEEKMSWQTRSRKTHAEEFLASEVKIAFIIARKEIM